MKLQRLSTRLGTAAIAVLLVAGLAQAQPGPDPQNPGAPPSEEPPPAPGEVGPSIVPPAEPIPPIVAPPPAAPKTDKADEDDADAEAKPVAAAPAPTGPPQKRPRHASAIMQAVDKITAETMRFEVRVGNHPVRYKGLVFTVKACETSAPDEPMNDAMAYVEVRAEPRAATEEQPSRQVFRGWMFASSPGLSAVKHPVYDAWLIACKA